MTCLSVRLMPNHSKSSGNHLSTSILYKTKEKFEFLPLSTRVLLENFSWQKAKECDHKNLSFMFLFLLFVWKQFYAVLMKWLGRRNIYSHPFSNHPEIGPIQCTTIARPINHFSFFSWLFFTFCYLEFSFISVLCSKQLQSIFHTN